MIAIYCRVSTDEQARNETITNQIDFARKFCELHGLAGVEFFTDEGVSGVIPVGDRPAGARLMQAASDGLSELLFYRLDRLGRSARIILNAVHELESHGVRVRSMTEPFDTGEPTGRFLLTVLAGVADLERETIVERTYAGMRRAVAKGKWPGHPPFGYRKDENGLAVPDETPIAGKEHLTPAGVVELIFNLVAKQNYTTVQVTNYLNAMEIPTALEIQKASGNFLRRKPSRKGWLPPFVWHLLSDETYAGRRVFHAEKTGEEIIVQVPAIVSREIYDKAHQVMAEHSRKNWYKPQYHYLLTGLVRCGICGKIYSGRTVKRRRVSDGELYLERRYLCSSKRNYGEKSCGNTNISADRLEDAVWKIIVEIVSNPGPVFEGLIRQSQVAQPDAYQEEEWRLASLLADKENEKQKVMSLFRKGLASLDEIEKQIGEIEKEKRVLQDRLAEVRGQLEDLRFARQRAGEAVDLVLQLAEQIKMPLPFEKKRRIVMCFIKEIIIYPDKPRKPRIKITTYFDQGNSEIGTSKPPTDRGRNFLSPSGVNKLRDLLENYF